MRMPSGAAPTEWRSQRLAAPEVQSRNGVVARVRDPHRTETLGEAVRLGADLDRLAVHLPRLRVHARDRVEVAVGHPHEAAAGGDPVGAGLELRSVSSAVGSSGAGAPSPAAATAPAARGFLPAPVRRPPPRSPPEPDPSDPPESRHDNDGNDGKRTAEHHGSDDTAAAAAPRARVGRFSCAISPGKAPNPPEDRPSMPVVGAGSARWPPAPSRPAPSAAGSVGAGSGGRRLGRRRLRAAAPPASAARSPVPPGSGAVPAGSPGAGLSRVSAASTSRSASSDAEWTRASGSFAIACIAELRQDVRDRLVQLARVRYRGVEVCVHLRRVVVARVRHAAGEHLEQDAAEGVHVGARVAAALDDPLGRQVVDRPDDRAGLRERRGRRDVARDAEVRQVRVLARRPVGRPARSPA